MIELTRFPKYVTSESYQSRQLGARLDRALGGKTPKEIIDDPDNLPEVMLELWHNLPCLTAESVLLCLPFYFHINGPHNTYDSSSPQLPPVWQLNFDYAWRLLTIDPNDPALRNTLQELEENERTKLTELCQIFEEEIQESFEHIRKIIETVH